MDWRLKCAALHVLRYLPHSLHGTLQRRVTGRYFLSLTDQEFSAYRYHADNFRRLKKPARALEFGAGSNLVSSLLLSAAGTEEVIAMDLERIATVEQVNHVVRQLREKIAGEWPEVNDLDEDLRTKYRVRYVAPGDARNTGLDTGSVDFFCSTSTLEHIPSRDIELILAECKRLASPQALLSFIIDYHDHYASSDSRITRLNFYKYPERTWRWLNPSNHFQNRLRHSDFEALFVKHGLQVVENRPVIPRLTIDRACFDHVFQKYSDDDLMALNGFFQLRISSEQPHLR